MAGLSPNLGRSLAKAFQAGVLVLLRFLLSLLSLLALLSLLSLLSLFKCLQKSLPPGASFGRRCWASWRCPSRPTPRAASSRGAAACA